ncbi:hypothetical protein LIER_43707 [Lithospermum erythrorhizon]|uniref:Uncharacterized protein n=1 Tax=Lithospermum erythrorhizon TaxID=34254 RepID=A0AAV3QPR7_LITER
MHCGAYKFYRETTQFRFSGGEISLVEYVLPEYLVQLITRNDAKSKRFQNMIRTYNNHFAFTSIGMSCDEKYERRDHGIYTVKVQGQIHHYHDDLMPQQASKKLSGVQLYFYDPDHQVTNRMMTLPRLDQSIVESLVELLKPNPYSELLRQAYELDEIDQYHIVIRANPELDQRRYNMPTSTEVAGIWTEDENND